jgi:Ca2+-binding RTX toxin-like protein
MPPTSQSDTQPPTPAGLFELLEARTLFAAGPAAVTAAVVDGALQVAGTRRADAISVAASAQDANLIEVRSGAGAGAGGGSLVGAFARAEFPDAVVIAGGKGNDTLSVDPALALPAVLSGGPGKDTLSGGASDDVLDGGPGKDRLSGGGGDDALDGGPGRDALDGGPGNDSLSGGPARDAVTGGEGADLFDDDRVAEVLDRAADEILTEPVVRARGRPA